MPVKPNLMVIVAVVLVVHAALLGLLLRESTPSRTGQLLPQHVVVKTVSLVEKSEPTATITEALTPSAPLPTKPQVVASPKSVKKPAEAKKPVETKKPVEAKKVAEVKQPEKPIVQNDRQAAAAKARASLAQMQQKDAVPASVVPQVVIALPIISSDSVPQVVQSHLAADPTYLDELTIRLKTMLRLPEYGEVKVHLNLERSGKVTGVTILQSESNVNRRYVETTLPKCKFPDFGKHFTDEAQHTFQLVLSNDL